MTNEHAPAPNMPEALSTEERAIHTEPTPEASQCSSCIHRPYCACRGKTGHCGNYIHMATRVIGGRFDLLRFKA